MQIPKTSDFIPGAKAQTRTWIIALIFVIAVAAGGAFTALVRYDLVGFGHLPRAAVWLCFLLLILNAAWLRLTGKRVFSTQQLVIVYVAIMVMCGLPGQQLVTYLYIGLVGAQHYATPENKWQELFFDYIPEWLVPSKDPDSPAVRYAFYGVPPGQQIPWGDWVGPLLVWTPYLLALLALGCTTAALLRRRWADEEHMLFPLAQLPVEMVTYDNERALMPKVFRHWVFWAAFLIPVLIYSKNALHYYYPVIPLTKLTPDLGVIFSGRPWNQLNYFPYHYYFEMMGITYLVSDEMAGSLWFFWLFRRLGGVVRESFGLTNHAEAFETQGFGAYIVLCILYLWYARHSLRAIAEKALYGTGSFNDRHEPMSAKVMFFGFIASLVTIIVWGSIIGARWWAVLGLLGFYMTSMVVLLRIVSEAGVFAVWTPFGNQEQVLSRILGHSALGPRTVTALTYMGLKVRDTASMTPANVIQGFKMSELVQTNPRNMALLIGVSLVLATFASHIPSLYAMYSHTIPSLGWWPATTGTMVGSGISGILQSVTPYTPGHYGNMALGALITLFLNYMRLNHTWWHLHPLAYTAIMGPSYMGDRYGFSIFIGWLVRRLVQNFGGYKAYNTGRAAAVGIIVGNAVILLSWSLLHFFHPISGVLIVE